MQRLQNPLPIWLDQRGNLVDAGNIYVGVANGDPELSPISVYWDAALTIPASQPLRTRGGVIVNNGSPANVFLAASDYSVRVRDADGALISYAPSGSATGSVSYQPTNPNLTAISALSSGSFGMQLVEAGDSGAARGLLGVTNFTGGNVSSNIVRNGAGPHLYYASGAYVSGRVFVTAAGAADPTSQDGDIWIETA